MRFQNHSRETTSSCHLNKITYESLRNAFVKKIGINFKNRQKCVMLPNANGSRKHLNIEFKY